jgi:hypothetical protein
MKSLVFLVYYILPPHYLNQTQAYLAVDYLLFGIRVFLCRFLISMSFRSVASTTECMWTVGLDEVLKTWSVSGLATEGLGIGIDSCTICIYIPILYCYIIMMHR